MYPFVCPTPQLVWVDRLALGGGGLMGGVPVCLDNTPACLGGQVGLGWGRVNGRCTRLFG